MEPRLHLLLVMKKEIKNLNYLEMTPVRLYSHEADAEGLVNVLIPRFTNKYLVKLIQPRLKDPFVRVRFDELGSFTWDCLDGVSKVREISTAISEKFGEKAHPTDERVLKFLSQLYRYKFISFNELIERKEPWVKF